MSYVLSEPDTRKFVAALIVDVYRELNEAFKEPGIDSGRPSPDALLGAASSLVAAALTAK